MSVRPLYRQRPLFAVAAAYGLGVWAGAVFVWRPVLWAAGLGICCLAAGLLRRSGQSVIAGVTGAFLFLGALLGGFANHPALPEPGRYTFTAVAATDIALREDGDAAGYLEQVRVLDEGALIRLPRAYWTYTPDPDDPFLPREGERVTFTGRLYAPPGRQNPYGFDFRMYLLQKGVTMGISGAAGGETAGCPGRGLSSLTYGARRWIGERLEAIFGEDSALPKALLIGQRDDLPQAVRRSFSDAGVAHVLAVSGLHVGLLASVLLLVLRGWLSPRGRLAALTVFLAVYCALLDFAAPVARASLLMVFTQLRRIVRRAPDGLTALSAAFLLILLVRPLDLFSASFQLSFLAVLGIVTLLPPLERRTAYLRPRALISGLEITLCATVGVALPTIQIYHRLSLVGVIVNPILCAVFAVLLPAYALILLAGCLWLPAGTWLAGCVNWVSRALVRGIEGVAALPFATVRVPYLPWYAAGALALAAVLCTRYVLWPVRRRVIVGVGCVAVAFGVWQGTLCRDVQYIQLAVGQADAALILDGAETVVIDVGESGGDAADYLLATGRNADRLILTHLHRDHCLGVRELLEQRVPIGEVYLPEGAEEQQVDEACVALLETLRAMDVPISFLHAGDTLDTARTHLEVTWPLPGAVRPGQDANRYALALWGDLDGLTLVSASDLPGDYERFAARDADILKVAHHGSNSSTGADFLAAVSPQIALITGSHAGAALPGASTLSRLEAAGVRVYNTGVCGAVTLTIRDGSGVLTTFLRQR